MPSFVPSSLIFVTTMRLSNILKLLNPQSILIRPNYYSLGHLFKNVLRPYFKQYFEHQKSSKLQSRNWRHTIQEIIKFHRRKSPSQMEQPSQQDLLDQRLTQEEKEELRLLDQRVRQFVQLHTGRYITLLTSGGTSVPLEKRAVRFIENFSTGLRGSLLAQALLEKDEPLIFFYRQNSRLPFSREISINSLLLHQSEEELQKVKKIRENLQQYKKNLLLLPFKTIYYYLQGLISLKAALPRQSIIILCAAVSDFIPKSVSEHKIHTSQSLNLQLINSPKILGKIAAGNDHLCVSFKLETDFDKLNQRVEFAMSKYGVDIVIGNILGNKKVVSITYNLARFTQVKQQKEDFEGNYERQVEEFIVDCVVKARKHKFGQ